MVSVSSRGLALQPRPAAGALARDLDVRAALPYARHVTVRRTGVERVTKTVRETDKATGEVHLERKVVPRNRWEIVADQFREVTPEQAARDPELRGAQRQMAIVESVVRSRAEPAAAERIMAAARTRIADWLERGARFEPPRAPERRGSIEADRSRERQR